MEPNGSMLERLRARMAKPTRQKPFESFKNIALGIAGVVSAIVIPIVGLIVSYEQQRVAESQKSQELGATFVDIGVKILQQPLPQDADESAKADDKALRDWAKSLINHYGEVPLPQRASTALDKTPIFDFGGPTTPASTIKADAVGRVLGVSLSHHDANVDFAALKAAGVDFVYLKATESDHLVDSKYTEYTQKALKAGIKVGLFHIFDPQADNSSQLANFTSALNTPGWTLPVVVDIEDGMNSRHSSLRDFQTRLAEFLKLLANRTGSAPIIYTGLYDAKMRLNASFAQYHLYVANYSKTPKAVPVIPPWTTTFWQVADTSDIHGLEGYPVTVFNGTADQLAKIAVR